MNTDQRRNNIYKTIANARAPISATALAQKFNVSRQIIVGDIALLRAEGTEILATPKGYILGNEEAPTFAYIGTVAVQHDGQGLLEELYTIVDFGGTVIDVTVEHSIYGQLEGRLDISSRYDADEFNKKVSGDDVKPLSDLTDGIHLHKIGCNDKLVFDKIVEVLREKNIAF